MTAPINERPYRLASRTGDERTYITVDGYRITFRQIGWHGQTGAFYALDEDPSKHEPGSFGPLWICVEREPVITDEETTP